MEQIPLLLLSPREIAESSRVSDGCPRDSAQRLRDAAALRDDGLTMPWTEAARLEPDAVRIEALLREVKDTVEVRLIDHTYSFGTHVAAQRRAVHEYLFIGR